MTVEEWIGEDSVKKNSRISLMLDAEVEDSGVYNCPVDDWSDIEKWAKVIDAGRTYIIVKQKESKIFHVKIYDKQ